MAYKRKFSGMTSRRRVRRKAQRNFRSLGKFRGSRRYVPRAFPPSRTVKLKYAQEITLNPTTSGIVYHDFCANGLYDPDVSTTGHQPVGFDQMIAAYDHYTVIGSKMKITPLSISTTNITPAYIAVGLYDDFGVPASFSSIEHMIEAGKLSRLAYTPASVEYRFPRSSYKNFSAKKFFKRNVLGSDDLRGSSTGNPSERAFFSVVAASIGANDPGTVTVLVEIEYIAIFSEPHVIAQS